MTRLQASIGFSPLRPHLGVRGLLRLASWGFCAGLALFVAISAATTDVGRNRLHLAAAEMREMWMSSGAKPVRPLDAREGRRLAEMVRELVSGREELRTRIATLEQGLGGVTGSISQIEKVAREAASVPTPNPAQADAAPNIPAPEDVTSSIMSIHPTAITPAPLPAPHAAKTEFGVDLGNATSVEALRTAWTAAFRRHAALLHGLRAVAQTRERGRAGAVELRLIAGPLASAAAAARLCAAMTAAGAVCAPATFEGQRLAVR